MVNSVHRSTAYEAIIHQAYSVKQSPTSKNWETLRAFFTAYCYLFDIYEGDYEFDDTLQHIADMTVDGKCDARFEEYMLYLMRLD